MGKSESPNWTINELFDFDSGQYIKVIDFFRNYRLDNEVDQDELIKLRLELEEAIQNKKQPKFGCWYCKGLVALRAVKSDKRKVYFKAIHSVDCKIKSKNISKEDILRIKYNGQQESILHKNLKSQISNLLELNKIHKKEIQKVVVEKVRKLSTEDNSKEWKKPDVFTYYKRRDSIFKVAIELQLTTTFIDVVISRQDFYRRDKSYILWVFNKFSIKRENQRMMQLDIIVSNNMNAFVMNENTIKKSYEDNDLVLLCYYKTYQRNGNEIKSKWNEQFVKLNDLSFDEDFSVYFFNSNKNYEELKNKINIEKKAIKIAQKQEVERKRVENELKASVARKKAQKEKSERYILDLIKEIKKVYKFKSFEDIPYWLNNRIKDLNTVETQSLNNKLKFKTDNVSFIHDLVRQGTHIVFFKFLLETKNIELELNKFDQENETLLTKYLEIQENNKVYDIIDSFVENGYLLTSIDKEFIKKRYVFNGFYSDSDIPNYLANLMITLNEKNFIHKLNRTPKLKRFIFAVNSVKYNTIIDWDYDNFRSLANQIFHKYEEFAFLFEKAIKQYNRIDDMILEDKIKNGKFRKKLNQFYDKGITETSNEDILKIAFPELFD